MKFTIATCALLASVKAEHWEESDQSAEWASSDVRESNATIDLIDGIEEVGEGLQEIADSFYENPEAFLSEIEATLVGGCYEDMEREARDMEEGQEALEEAWRELTRRANQQGARVLNQRRVSERRWDGVQEFVDKLNEFGRDPSGYMDMGREMATEQKRAQCDQFATMMAQWKEKVLRDLQERDEYEPWEGLNLAESMCIDGEAVDSFGDGCDWYVVNPGSCGTFDHEFFTAATECCACGGGMAPEPECADTNNGFGDVGGDQCDWYERNPGSCGSYDTPDFVANEMCCTCGGGSTAAEPVCADTNNGLGDAGGDGCDWYVDRLGSCGAFDTVDFIAAEMCCACGGGATGPLQVPEWNIDLDYDQADRYSAELEAAYREHHAQVADILTRWQAARDEVDQHYWNEELLPVLADGERLDERTMRTLVTWIAEGTQIKGRPLVEVFPEVEDWMLHNYNPEGSTLVETFRMEEMPMNLSEEGPVTFSFTFDEAAIQEWLEQEGRMYQQIDAMYQRTWEEYVQAMVPLWENMGAVNEQYKARFDELDVTLQYQIEDTFSDAEHWWSDHFTISLAAKIAGKNQSGSNYGMYAAIGATTLAAMFIAGLAYRNKKTEDTMTNTAVSEALVQ